MIKESGLQKKHHKVVGVFLAAKKELVKKSHVEVADDPKVNEQDSNSVVECSGCHVEHLLLEEQTNCCPVRCVSGRQRPLHVIF